MGRARAGLLAASLLALAVILLPWIEQTPTVGGEGDALPRVLIAGHSSNPDEPYHGGLLEFARIVEERSEGRLRVEVYPSGQLGSERMMIEGLLLGTIDIVVAANGSASSFVPELAVLDLPFLFDDREHMFRVLDGEVGETLRASASKRGFRILAYLDAGVRHIMTRSRPLERLDDLRGLKIRTMPVPTHLDAFDAFGAQAIALNYGEVYGSLQTGLIDGAEAANTNFTRKNFYEVAPNWAQVGWIILVANMMMSESALAALPADLREIIHEAAEVAADHERLLYRESDEALLERIREIGVNVTYPDPAPFRAVAEQVYQQRMQSPSEQALLRAIRAEAVMGASAEED
ncbi:MAG: TRAP transporter substrate-binding protein [Kangiellaceae bacterium]|jgi:tripartite ATP-independent transporter DctP family solute receptor|nr:TRAP transporter substrate-binding protein [Kangiellaceae bacterium]